MKATDLKPVKDKFLKLANEKVWEREAAFLVQLVNDSPQLQKTPLISRLKALYNVAVTGLTLNPIHKFAYLLTRNKKTEQGWVNDCYLEPSYRGLVHLAVKGGMTQIYSHPVYDGDEFEITLGSSMEVTHKPKFKSKEILQSYAIAKWDTHEQIEVLTIDDLNAIMSKSEGVKAALKDKSKEKYAVWLNEWKPEMVRKAAIKRLCKYLPQVNDYLNQAIDLDNENYSLDASPQQVTLIEQLLGTSTLGDEARFDLEAQIEGGITVNQAGKYINHLMDFQQLPGTQKTPTSMKEVNAAVNYQLENEKA